MRRPVRCCCTSNRSHISCVYLKTKARRGCLWKSPRLVEIHSEDLMRQPRSRSRLWVEFLMSFVPVLNFLKNRIDKIRILPTLFGCATRHNLGYLYEAEPSLNSLSNAPQEDLFLDSQGVRCKARQVGLWQSKHKILLRSLEEL
ncbi:hypothetical protein QCA50_014512 [Cerrena zonata]|uniref:Uncharacterized protein n=1 Tax=Cerrena zonata TaxID=2478898 RepID=A0AAW0FTC9_9APHY